MEHYTGGKLVSGKADAIQLNYAVLHSLADQPVYGSEGAARFDLSAVTVKAVRAVDATIIFGTGLAFEIPFGWEMVVMGRSGLGFNHNIRLSNCEGVIDSDFRGEVLIAITADTDRGWQELCRLADLIDESKPQRMAQGKLQQAQRVHFTRVVTLSETTRGVDGLGSTGTQRISRKQFEDAMPDYSSSRDDAELEATTVKLID